MPSDEMQTAADDSTVFSDGMLRAAADASLPAGVIAVRDEHGHWWRYPLIEYSD